ncbi:alpha/beta hydrolase [Amaricoccus sp.]|uniref:alpha/beta fold hydrolase n=1 Tax=Amaricoccus sp. TaxID=1872485 RepID=UPI001B57E79E|nr:alpha/beta hydrolase [Amaricoccus sp.]MBP7242329.1 alpha/beta hydrolase [Amaricoccus sp.]
MTDRPPLLFLHGAFAGPEVWTRFVAPWFVRRGHRVAAPLMPGRTSYHARMRDYVRVAREAAEELGRPVAVAHSLGGLVAQHLAAEGRLSGVVLVSSPGPMGLAPTLWNLAASPDVLAALLVAQAGAGDRYGPEALRRALFTDETPDDWILGLGLNLSPESPSALADGLAWDLPAWPLARSTPMLAVQGDRDAFVPITDLWSIAMAYGAETTLLPGLGHGLPIDPAWKSLAWRISAWLGERQIGVRAPRPWLTAFGFAS